MLERNCWAAFAPATILMSTPFIFWSLDFLLLIRASLYFVLYFSFFICFQHSAIHLICERLQVLIQLDSTWSSPTIMIDSHVSWYLWQCDSCSLFLSGKTVNNNHNKVHWTMRFVIRIDLRILTVRWQSQAAHSHYHQEHDTPNTPNTHKSHETPGISWMVEIRATLTELSRTMPANFEEWPKDCRR